MTTLYRYYDAYGRLLYVGITGAGRTRQTAHVNSSTWWSEVAFATYEHVPSRELAHRAESAVIRAERPLYNKSPGCLPRPRPPVTFTDDELIVLP